VKLGALLGFHRNTMGELLKEGAFPNAVQVGNKKLVPQSDVEAWLKKMRITQSKEVA
jgi:excisionase family DNA binding protein